MVAMNVKCPYCECSYELGADILKDPVGNEKLGYGWWLRCYRCKRKWWLRNTVVEMKMNTPIKVDKTAQIQRISAFSRKKTVNTKKRGIRWGKYVIYAVLITGAVTCYYQRTIFYDFLLKKAQHLSENVISKVAMSDVKYDVSPDNILTVTGDISNYDEKVIAKVNGLKVTVFDNKSVVISWNNDFDNLRILPQQKSPFSVNKQLPGDIKDIRVEVSVY